MTPALDRVAVVATHLAAADRRALSQAWYSALHLAHERPPTPQRVPHENASLANHLTTVTPGRPVIPSVVEGPPRSRPQRAGVSHATAPERRQPPTASARRIERAIATLTAAPHHRIARTVAIDGGRVRILVRTDDRATRIIALCAEPLRDPVERALARVRFTLAARA